MAVTGRRAAVSTGVLRGSAGFGADGVAGHVAAVAISSLGGGTIFAGIIIIPTRAAAIDLAYTGASGSDAAYVGASDGDSPYTGAVTADAAAVGAGAGDLALVGAVGSDSEV
jgi:hypothetical protein